MQCSGIYSWSAVHIAGVVADAAVCFTAGVRVDLTSGVTAQPCSGRYSGDADSGFISGVKVTLFESNIGVTQ